MGEPASIPSLSVSPPKQMDCDSEPCFLADAMLGRLARWLRILGYDTRYLRDVTDDEVISWARAEGRMILTRDRELSRRRGVNALLITSTRLTEQLRQVIATLSLDVRHPFRRCVVCNVALEEMSREQARPFVPLYVYRTQEDFGRCPACGRIYWRGTHWAHMAEQLRSLEVQG